MNAKTQASAANETSKSAQQEHLILEGEVTMKEKISNFGTTAAAYIMPALKVLAMAGIGAAAGYATYKYKSDRAAGRSAAPMSM